MKTCRDCKEYKQEISFIKNKLFKTGIDTLCLECNRKRVKIWRKLNPDKRKIQRDKETRKRIDSGRAAYTTSKYLASRLKRTPKWADLNKIKEFYMNCPEGYHVDHIHPLQGEIISGLHIIENLQYLIASENMSKGNKYYLN